MVNLPTYSKTISIIEWWLSTQKVPNKADFASFHIYGHVTSDEAKNECIGNIFFKNQSCRQKKNQEELKKPQTRDYLSSKLVNNYAKCGFSSLIAKNTEKMIGWVLKTKTRMVQQNNRQQKKKISIWQQQSRRNHNDDEHNFFFQLSWLQTFFWKESRQQFFMPNDSKIKQISAYYKAGCASVHCDIIIAMQWAWACAAS